MLTHCVFTATGYKELKFLDVEVENQVSDEPDQNKGDGQA
jgi:hypothetical protein